MARGVLRSAQPKALRIPRQGLRLAGTGRRSPTESEITIRRAEKQRIRGEISRLRNEIRVINERHADTRYEQAREIKARQQEIFQLKHEFRTIEEGGRDDALGPVTEALPDFLIIGAQKCGTTSLYRLLVGHPYVEPAATKELHFFDNQFDKGVEWYRRCFPRPIWKDGRRTVTGEATPAYLSHPEVPEKVAQVVPGAQLIVLLRNPVDRSYSQYHQRVRKGRESSGFEEAMAATRTRPPDRQEGLGGLLSRSLYVDQLVRWHRFFERDRTLVLKSEDFFARPWETLEHVLGFLGLPEWEPEGWETHNEGRYGDMDPLTRQRLEEFFEPHNRRLYDYLGVDFGW
jgi:hypothetical protein